MITPHPGLPEFDYIKPANLHEAVEFLLKHPGEARIFMGGTDTLVRMRDGFWNEKYLVDVKQLEGMQELSFDPNRGLTIGAAVNMNKVIHNSFAQESYPLLVEAAQTVASYPLRSRATIVGNICNASPAGDTIGACLVYGGVLRIFGAAGYREEKVDAFFLNPGKTTLKPGEIVTQIFMPVPPAGHQGKYVKLGRNKLGDLAIVGVTVFGFKDPSAQSGYRFRIALASVAPVPMFCKEAEKFLESECISTETIEQAALKAMDACHPIDDVRGGARYRKLMVRNLVKNGLETVWKALVGKRGSWR